MQNPLLYLTQFLTLFSVFQQGLSYFLTVDAHAEECFFDKVEVGSKLGMLFVIAVLHGCVVTKHTLLIIVVIFIHFFFNQ